MTMLRLLTPETVELFSLPKAVLPILSALYQSCCNKNSKTFLTNSIVPDLFKWTFIQMSFSVNGVNVVNKGDIALALYRNVVSIKIGSSRTDWKMILCNGNTV